jgi:uncharacterized protein
VLATGSEDLRDDRKALERLCVATREVKPVGGLIRFVVSPDGVLTPDLKRKLPGRGVWVTATRAAVEQAVRKHLFVRSLKSSVDVPSDLGAKVELLLERSVLQGDGAHRGGSGGGRHQRAGRRSRRLEEACRSGAAYLSGR